jgi:PAS domain S-box-containing protein
MARAAFDANPDAVLIVDASGVIVQANRAAHDMFLHADQSLAGQSVEVLVPEMNRQRHVAQRAGYAARPLSRPMGLGQGLMAERADGSNIPVEISLSPIEVDGAVATIATVRDVTDRLIDRSEARRNAARLEMMEERERIGRDLHDMVIQRLFAAGMSLQAVAPLVSAPTATERIIAIIDELDDTIRDIRNTIFELHLRRRPAASERLRDLIGDRAELLGFEPGLAIEGEIDDLPTDLADDLLAAIGESLSNATRHARANSVMVHVERQPRQLCVRVSDDGVGMPTDPQPGHGLSNLLWRAANHGGRCTWRPRDGGGTVVEWQVPLAA